MDDLYFWIALDFSQKGNQGPIFDSLISTSKDIKNVISVCWLGCTNLSKFTCYTIRFHCHHASIKGSKENKALENVTVIPLDDS